MAGESNSFTPALAGSGEKTELGEVSLAAVVVAQADSEPLGEVAHPGFEKNLRADPKAAVQAARTKDDTQGAQAEASKYIKNPYQKQQRAEK